MGLYKLWIQRGAEKTIMKTLKEILNKPKWKIVDEEGNTIESGFRLKTTAMQNRHLFKLSRQDKLKVEEEI